MEDWDIISTKDVIGSEQHLVERTKTLASAALPFTQSILSQVASAFGHTHTATSSCSIRSWLTVCFCLCKGWSDPVPGPAGPQLVV